MNAWKTNNAQRSILLSEIGSRMFLCAHCSLPLDSDSVAGSLRITDAAKLQTVQTSARDPVRMLQGIRNSETAAAVTVCC